MKDLLRDWDVTIEEESHTYTHEPSGDEYISATTFLGQFFEKFDGDAIIDKYYDKWQEEEGGKYYGLEKDEIKQVWVLNNEDASSHGTRVHDAIEKYLLAEIDEVHISEMEGRDQSKAMNGILWVKQWENHNPPMMCFPERIIYSDQYNIAGTIDLLYYDEHTKHVYLMDWKTNKSIDKYGFKGKRCKEPISDLQDCNFTKYTLQLSLYAYILESEWGCDIRDLTLIHLTEDEAVSIPVLYQKDYIVAMLEYTHDN